MSDIAFNVNLKFTSWNVRGLVKLAKVKQVITRLKQIKSSVVYLQETHLLSDEVMKIKRRWPGQVISASYSSYTYYDPDSQICPF